MCIAATRGLIDFSQGRPWSEHWMRWLRWQLYGLKQNLLIEIYRLQFQFGLSQLSLLDRLSDNSQNRLSKIIRTSYRNLVRQIIPWIELSPDQDTSVQQELMQLWIKRWGDPNSPEVRQQIEQTIDELMQRSQEQTEPAGAFQNYVQTAWQARQRLKAMEQIARRATKTSSK